MIIVSDAAQVQAVRDEYGMSLNSAKRAVRGRDLRRAIVAAKDYEDLKPILMEVVSEFFPYLPDERT